MWSVYRKLRPPITGGSINVIGKQRGAAPGGANALKGSASVQYPDGFGSRKNSETNLAVTDIGQTHILYSSTDGKTVTLPAANASGMTQGRGVGFRVLPRSKPIRILNAGTAGTDAILEAFALPGADFTLFANSVNTAAGDWRGVHGMFHGPISVSQPASLDPGVDFGSTYSSSSYAFTAPIIQNTIITRLTSSLFIVCGIPAAGTSVVAYALSYNNATDAWTWGTPVTVFSSANRGHAHL